MGASVVLALLVPKPLLGNPGRVLSPGSPHAHLSLYPPPPPSNQAQAIPPTLLVFRILAASRLTLHFEPASPLHRENQRITETGEGTTPTPHLHLWPSKAAKRPKACNLFSSNQEIPILPMYRPHPLQGPFYAFFHSDPRTVHAPQPLIF